MGLTCQELTPFFKFPLEVSPASLFSKPLPHPALSGYVGAGPGVGEGAPNLGTDTHDEPVKYGATLETQCP